MSSSQFQVIRIWTNLPQLIKCNLLGTQDNLQSANFVMEHMPEQPFNVICISCSKERRAGAAPLHCDLTFHKAVLMVLQGLVDNDQEDEEEFEVDIQEDEAAFLKGISSRSGVEMSPIKIVKNPDGSLQRAAMTQSALAKERRELREQQQRTLIEAIPKDLSRPWEDPLPEQGERHLAQELRGIGLGGFEVPEWKKQAEGKVRPVPFPSPTPVIMVVHSAICRAHTC